MAAACADGVQVRKLLPTRMLHLGGDEVDMKCWDEAAKRTHSKQRDPLQHFQVRVGPTRW